MSLLAMIGFLFGALAAAGFVIAAGRLQPDALKPEPAVPESKSKVPAPKQPAEASPREPVSLAVVEKPLIARLRNFDVMRTLGGILAIGGIADVTKLGWPTLRMGQPSTTFPGKLRKIRAAIVRRSPKIAMPVVAVIGAGPGDERSIAALNFALAAAGDGVRVLLIDADHEAARLSERLNRLGKSERSRPGWLSIGSKASRLVATANGISILPAVKGPGTMAASSIHKAIARIRALGGPELAILDGPAMPWSVADRKLLDSADALVAVLPVSLDINDAMEDIIVALGPAQDKLVGVILNELGSSAVTQQRGKQYA
jgi:Mrp family chromosome partitioning ATPase